MHSNLTTGQVTNESLKEGLDRLITNCKESLADASKPILMEHIYTVPPDVYRDMQAKGYIKDGRLTKAGQWYIFR